MFAPEGITSLVFDHQGAAPSGAVISVVTS